LKWSTSHITHASGSFSRAACVNISVSRSSMWRRLSSPVRPSVCDAFSSASFARPSSSCSSLMRSSDFTRASSSAKLIGFVM
jgi:hypothetical protein